MVLEYFEKDIVGQCLGCGIWLCTTQVSMLCKDRGARNLRTSPLLIARYKRTLSFATYNAAKKDMWEVVLA